MTCNGTSVGYGRVSAVDDFVISVYGGIIRILDGVRYIGGLLNLLLIV